MAASYGGPGWQSRTRSHAEEVSQGILWHACGVQSEVSDLASVLLARPVKRMFPGGNANDWLLLDWPNYNLLKAQAARIASFYRSRGIEVFWAESDAPALPNFLFQRDLFFMTPEGAVLARPASRQRSLEARFCAAALSKLGIPILATPRGDAHFEGADALWLDSETVLLGVGQRTNSAGAAFVSSLLAEMRVATITVGLPSGVQHLLGVVNFVDYRLAMVRSDKLTVHLRRVLRDAGIEILPIAADAGVTKNLGMNFVVLSPRVVVMPAGCDSVRTVLHNNGIKVWELDVSEYCKAAGGLGCLTGILHRQMNGMAMSSDSST
jgi:N-dimethylarginine dimethylaminohydrolase